LPEAKEVIKLAVNTGLTKTLERDTTTGRIIFSNQPKPASGSITKLWVVRAGTFSFSSQSSIPASTLTYGTTNSYSKNITGTGNIAIRPMNLTGITSSHNLQISKNTAGSTPMDVTDWTMISNTGNLPATLWGAPLTDSAGVFVQAPSVPSNDTVSNQLTGYFVKVPEAVLGATFGVVSMTDLAEEIIWPGIAQNPFSLHPTRSAEYAPSASSTTIADIAGIATTVSANRNALYTVLSHNQIYSGLNNAMQGLAADAANMFAESPMEQS
jgi:hypothetical protein